MTIRMSEALWAWRWGSSHAITRSPLALILSALSHFVQAATVEAHDVRLRNFGLV
jgi:hypothetical protein